MDFALARSTIAMAYVCAVASAALIAALASAAPVEAKAAISLAVAVASLRAVRAFRGGRAVHRLVTDLSGRMEVTHAEGPIEAGRLAQGSFVAPFLTIVRWHPDGARFSRAVVIFPDAIAKEDFRRLRVLLRWRQERPGRSAHAIIREWIRKTRPRSASSRCPAASPSPPSASRS
jgi:hypothetical protein